MTVYLNEYQLDKTAFNSIYGCYELVKNNNEDCIECSFNNIEFTFFKKTNGVCVHIRISKIINIKMLVTALKWEQGQVVFYNINDPIYDWIVIGRRTNKNV